MCDAGLASGEYSVGCRARLGLGVLGPPAVALSRNKAVTLEEWSLFGSMTFRPGSPFSSVGLRSSWVVVAKRPALRNI